MMWCWHRWLNTWDMPEGWVIETEYRTCKKCGKWQARHPQYGDWQTITVPFSTFMAMIRKACE